MSSVVIAGNTSGSVTLAAPDVAGSTTLNLPTISGGTLVTSDASGNVGIGVTNPAYPLEIQTGTDTRLRIENNGGLNASLITSTNNARNAYKPVTIGSSYFTVQTNGTEKLSIDSAGSTTFAAQVQAKHVDASGYAYRAIASATGSNAIQFTSNGGTEQAYIGNPTNNALVLRSTAGSASSYDQTWTNINGMSLGINKVNANNTDIGDWPTPVLSLKNYDSNFQGITMQTWGGRDDNVGYTTSNGIWSIRLWSTTSTPGWTTSSSTTEMVLAGPGPLVCTASTNGVRLTVGATSWVSASDERLKDIIEHIDNAAEKVSTLRAVIGKYKTDEEGTRRPFLIAQDVQAVLPEAVVEASIREEVDSENPLKVIKQNDYLHLSYSEVVPLLVAAIKELTERIKVLESK